MQLLSLLKELSLHTDNASKLKGLILDLAVKGKLTENWRKDNPKVESAEILFSRVKLYNENLLKNKGRRIKINNTELDLQLEIPETWITVRNSDLFTLQKGTNPKDLTETVKKYPYQDIEALDRGNIRRYSDDEKAPKCTDDDILVVCDGSRSGLVLNGKGGIVGSTLAIIETPYFIQDYIKILFLQDYERANANMIGAAIPHLDTKTLLNTEIGFPPLEEQKAIVEVVNQLFAEVEKLEALTKKRISLKEDFVTSALRRLTETHNTATEWNGLKDQLSTFFSEKNSVKKLREAILQLAVQGKLTAKWRANNPNIEPASELLKRIEAEKKQLIKEKKIKKEAPLPAITKDEVTYDLPKGWVWCRFQEVFDIRDGTHDSPKDSLDKVTYPLVTSKNFNNGEIDFDSARRISKEDYLKVIQRSQVHNGDILFSMIGGNIGNQVEVGEFTEYAIKNVALFKHYRYGLPAKGFLKVFSKYIAMSLQSEAAGGAQPFVSLKFFRNLVLGLPPKEEQKAIVEQVNSLMALCDELEQQIEISHTQVEQLMQSCLKEVFEIA
jgi:type I restriction enzyme S subunit